MLRRVGHLPRVILSDPDPIPMSSPSAAPPAGTSRQSIPAEAVPAVRGVERELLWIRVILGFCFLATLALSWRLWLSSGRDYPLVPVIDGMPQPPFPLDWLLLAGMTAALLGMSFAQRPRPYAIAVLAIMAVWLVLDQTRWQPYVLTYLAGTVCVLLGDSPAVRAPGHPASRWYMAPFQLSLCAIYFYSGTHKLNARFVQSSFPSWVNPFTDLLGLDPESIPRLLFWPGVGAAAGEAAMGLALLFPRTRRPAVVGLTLMHAYIMLVLGRMGLAGNSVVWPWNVMVVAILWLLFWPRGAGARLDGFIRDWWAGMRGRAGAAAVPRPLKLAWGGVIVLFGLLPALSFAELWDASLSFQLYAGKHRNVRIYYPPDPRAALPPAMLRSAHRAGEVNLTRWAMAELNVVPVMETRVVTRIGREVARRAPDTDVRVVIAGAPAIVSGRRGYRSFAFEGPDKLPREIANEREIPGIGPTRRPAADVSKTPRAEPRRR
jgi:hypothetical protein